MEPSQRSDPATFRRPATRPHGAIVPPLHQIGGPGGDTRRSVTPPRGSPGRSPGFRRGDDPARDRGERPGLFVSRVPSRANASRNRSMRRRASSQSSLPRFRLRRSMYHGGCTRLVRYASTMARTMGSVVVFESSWTSRSRAVRSFLYSSSMRRSRSARVNGSPAWTPAAGSASVSPAALWSHSQRMDRRISPVACSPRSREIGSSIPPASRLRLVERPGHGDDDARRARLAKP